MVGVVGIGFALYEVGAFGQFLAPRRAELPAFAGIVEEPFGSACRSTGTTKR